MSIWNARHEAIAESPGGDYIQESGCYVGMIERVQLISGTAPSKARGLKFFIKTTDQKKANFVFWYIKKDGKDAQNYADMLTRACYILNINYNNIQVSTITEDEKQIQIATDFENKELGFFLLHKYKKYIEFDIKDVFHPYSLLSAPEMEEDKIMEEDKKPEKFYFWKDAFENRNKTYKKPQQSEKKQNSKPNSNLSTAQRALNEYDSNKGAVEEDKYKTKQEQITRAPVATPASNGFPYPAK